MTDAITSISNLQPDVPSLSVRLFGPVRLSAGDARIAQDGNRARQTWLIVAYLICNRHRAVSYDELIRLLAAERKSDNPAGILKTAIWRVRKTLKPLCDELGCELVKTCWGGVRFH